MLHIGLMLIVLHIVYGYENIALNKPTQQSHVYIRKDNEEATFDSSNAVDGLKTDLSAFGGQCVISADGYNTATWWVDLTYIHSIHDIRIYYRTDNAPWGSPNGYTTMFLGFYVYVSNTTNRHDGQLCFHDTNYTRATIPAVIDIECPVHGQYVIYYNERPQISSHSSQFSRNAHNDLCEVEVNGCKKTGYYGSNCSIVCPKNCQHRYCHIETGACLGCIPGYQGHQCELLCSSSFYGKFCFEKCGNCSEGVSCNHVNGTCTNGCDVGVYGDKCKTPCPVGWYGKNCSEMCSNCDMCDRFTGQCTSSCHTGWKGLYCTEECDGDRYGQDCRLSCGACLDFKQCHHINGSCLEGCDAAFKGELCKTGCSEGTFGINCEQICNENCGVPYRCNRATGECEDGCQPGWEGPQCEQVCKQNRYGKNCTYICGFCENSVCHHVNGSCVGGCKVGYQGPFCNEVCNKGFYGDNCRKECSLFCKTSRDCHHVTGHCNDGCIGGWQGVRCLQVAEKVDDLEWPSRFYGVLAALCICITIIVVLIVYICISRRKAVERNEKGKCKKDNETNSEILDLNIISGKTDENYSGTYQELGELALPSDYDHLR